MELQQYIEQFRKQGLGVVAISYDSVGILADFAKRQGIIYPLLSDAGSKIIKDFGIFNTHVQQNDWHYGIANPGTYRVNAEGIVESKYFLEDAHERYSAPTVLLREFGSVAGTRETVVNNNHLALKYYSTRDVLRPDVRFTLAADFDLKPKMHVYAPGVEHYIPVSIELDRSNYFFTNAVEFPKPEILHLPAINETVPVFQGKFRISRDITMRERDALGTLRELKIKGRLRYQACDDKTCYLPQNVPLEWDLRVDMLNNVSGRPPVPVQHGGDKPLHEGGSVALATGLEVGQKIPAFSALDQHGKTQNFDAIRGPNGAMIVFFQSADWSSYCKSQLVEMQQYWEEFRNQGVGFAAVSYDSVEILADFAKRKGITFPMLSDPQSKIIKAFGLLNSHTQKSDMRYGMANPGSYRVDVDGVVRSKYFAQDVSERYSTPAILLKEFGSLAGERERVAATDYLDLKYYSVGAVRPASHIILAADLVLKPGMRVIAPGVEKDVQRYIPLGLEVDPSYFYMAQPAEYPRAEVLPLPAANGTIPSYQGTVRITQDVTIQGRDTLSELPPITIKGRVRFQPCDDKACYVPQTIPVEWNLKMTPLEYERSPDQIQHLYAVEEPNVQR